jgi:hypothetical protein
MAYDIYHQWWRRHLTPNNELTHLVVTTETITYTTYLLVVEMLRDESFILGSTYLLK